MLSGRIFQSVVHGVILLIPWTYSVGNFPYSSYASYHISVEVPEDFQLGDDYSTDQTLSSSFKESFK